MFKKYCKFCYICEFILQIYIYIYTRSYLIVKKKYKQSFFVNIFLGGAAMVAFSPREVRHPNGCHLPIMGGTTPKGSLPTQWGMHSIHRAVTYPRTYPSWEAQHPKGHHPTNMGGVTPKGPKPTQQGVQ